MIAPTLKRPDWPAPAPAARLDMGQDELEILKRMATVFTLAPQERLPLAINDAEAVWLVDRGLVRLCQGRLQDKGSTCMLLESGDVFVAVGLSPWHDQLVALKASRLFRLTQLQIKVLLKAYPALAHRIIEFSWCRIARLQRHLAELMTKPVKERLALLLLKLATEYGEDRTGGTRSLGLAVTHEDLARLVGASREMVSKVMRQFRDAGWVQSSRKTIEVVNLGAMSDAAEERFSVLAGYHF